jgi:hypothetical protein
MKFSFCYKDYFDTVYDLNILVIWLLIFDMEIRKTSKTWCTFPSEYVILSSTVISVAASVAMYHSINKASQVLEGLFVSHP